MMIRLVALSRSIHLRTQHAVVFSHWIKTIVALLLHSAECLKVHVKLCGPCKSLGLCWHLLMGQLLANECMQWCTRYRCIAKQWGHTMPRVIIVLTLFPFLYCCRRYQLSAVSFATIRNDPGKENFKQLKSFSDLIYHWMSIFGFQFNRRDFILHWPIPKS